MRGKKYVCIGEDKYEIVKESGGWYICAENRFLKCNPLISVSVEKDDEKAEASADEHTEE